MQSLGGMQTNLRSCVTKVLCVAILASSGCGVDALSVDAVFAQAPALVGQRVRVRGYSQVAYESTLVGCGNNQCCNAAWLHLFLTATAPPLSTQSEVQLLEVRAAANKPLCSGNECSVTCEPFDPHAARAFEISGILHAEAHERCPPSGAPPEPCPPPYVRAWLEEVDLSASSRLEGDQDLEDLSRLPIETGSFVVAVKRKSP